MTEFGIRDAAPDDAAAIASIYEPYVRTTCVTFEEIPPSPAEIASRMQQIRERGLPFHVAEKAQGVIGYAYAAPFHPRSAYRYAVEDSVYVERSHAGQGIGTALMQRLIEECAALGYRQMIALIGDQENQASIRLHARLGFRQIGILSGVGLKLGRWVDVTEMQLALGDGAQTIPS